MVFFLQFLKVEVSDFFDVEKEWKMIDDFFKKMFMYGVLYWYVIELFG